MFNYCARIDNSTATVCFKTLCHKDYFDKPRRAEGLGLRRRLAAGLPPSFGIHPFEGPFWRPPLHLWYSSIGKHTFLYSLWAVELSCEEPPTAPTSDWGTSALVLCSMCPWMQKLKACPPPHPSPLRYVDSRETHEKLSHACHAIHIRAMPELITECIHDFAALSLSLVLTIILLRCLSEQLKRS